MIHRKTAQQIADTVKEVCGYDINFINDRGLVIASTDPARIGTVHEGGRQVIARGETLEVEQDDLLPGTKKGVNIPVFRGGVLAAVIGISGDPEKVRAFAHLAERITLLILREQEIGARARSLAEKKNYLLDLLLEEDRQIASDSLPELLEELKQFHIDPSSPKRMLLLKLRYPEKESLSGLERDAARLLDELPGCLYGYQYPSSFRALINDRDLELFREKLDQFHAAHPFALLAGAGSSVPLEDLPRSLSTARIALEALGKGENFFLFDDLTLEVLLSGISRENQKLFLEKVLSPLSDEDLRLLETYFEKDQSLAATCQALFLHKNTVQYRLNRIHRLCGLNPRSFRDAAVLYLSLKVRHCYT